MAADETTQYALGRLEAKLDVLLQYREEQIRRTDALEQRVSKLEAWKWTLFGAAGALGGGAGLIAQTIGIGG